MSGHRLVLTLEDGGVHGGVGSAVSAALRAAGVDVPCRDLGVPQEFLDHGSRNQVLERVGLTAQQITHDVVAQVLGTKVPVARPLAEDTAPATGQFPQR